MTRLGKLSPDDHHSDSDSDDNSHHNANHHSSSSNSNKATKYSKLLAIDNMLATAICEKANLLNPIFPQNITIDDDLYFSSGKSHEIAVLYDAANNENAKLNLYAESFCFFSNQFLDSTTLPTLEISFTDVLDSNSPYSVKGVVSNNNTENRWHAYNASTGATEVYMNISETGDISSRGELFIVDIIDSNDSNYSDLCDYFKVNLTDGVEVNNLPFKVLTCAVDTTDSSATTSNLLYANPTDNTVSIIGDEFKVNDSFSVTTSHLQTNLSVFFEDNLDVDGIFKVGDTTSNFIVDDADKVSTNALPIEINGSYARLNTTDISYPSNNEDLIRKIDLERLLQGLRPKGSVDIMTNMSEWTPTITEIASTGEPGSITFESSADILSDTNVTQSVDIEIGSFILLNKISNDTNDVSINFTGIYSWNVKQQPGDTSLDGDYTSISDCNADTNCDTNADTNMSPAVADITVTNGIVTSFVLTNTGEGYSAGDVATFILDTNDTNSVFEINVTQNIQVACGIYKVSAGVLDTATSTYTYTWERRDNMKNGSNVVGATVFVTDGNFENILFIQINDEYQSGEGLPPVSNTTTYVGQIGLEFDTQSNLLFTPGPGIDITAQLISIDIGQADSNLVNNLIFSHDPANHASHLTIKENPVFSPSGIGAISTSINAEGISLEGVNGPAIKLQTNGDVNGAGQTSGLYFSRNDEPVDTYMQTYYNGDYSSDLQFYVTQKLQDTNDTNDTNWSSSPYLAMTIQPTDISSTANIGINNTNPAHALDVVGNVRGSQIIAISDMRLKENIKPLENSLNKVLAMQGVSYNLISDDNKVTHVGVIAQDIEKVLPEVVNTDQNDMKSVAYGNITAVLIEAVKELQEKVLQLESVITDLKK